MRAVLLDHEGHGPRHYDLVIARGTRCPTLRLVPGRPLAVSWSFPHRHRYLTYAGPVGGGRGVVRRCWSGVVDYRPRRLRVGAGFPWGLRIVPLPPGPSCRP